MNLQAVRRRVLYVVIYEVIAIATSGLGLWFFSQRPVEDAFLAAVLASGIAVAWNYTFNSLFERWEARQTVKGRSLKRRVIHALGFELGLSVFLIPLFAWKLQVSLWQALVLDIGLLLFFLVYTFVFTWCFDRFFGLPPSAKTALEQDALATANSAS